MNEPVTSPLTLRELTAAEIEVLARGDCPLAAADGWPTVDTADGARLAGAGARMFVAMVDGVVVGDGGTHASPAHGRVEIGYALAHSCRGRGLGRQLVAALVAELGTTLTLTARTDVDNLASQRCLVDAGFTLSDVHGRELNYTRNS
jgi:RimJ/RimL family protein N-acetyltransferase